MKCGRVSSQRPYARKKKDRTARWSNLSRSWQPDPPSRLSTPPPSPPCHDCVREPKERDETRSAHTPKHGRPDHVPCGPPCVPCPPNTVHCPQSRSVDTHQLVPNPLRHETAHVGIPPPSALDFIHSRRRRTHVLDSPLPTSGPAQSGPAQQRHSS